MMLSSSKSGRWSPGVTIMVIVPSSSTTGSDVSTKGGGVITTFPSSSAMMYRFSGGVNSTMISTSSAPLGTMVALTGG